MAAIQQKFTCPNNIDDKIEDMYIKFCSSNNISVDCDTMEQLCRLESLIEKLKNLPKRNSLK